jgi:predicted nucleotidyltransferase
MKQDINNKIVDYLRKYDPLKIGIFGSYARGEETEQSDIDILVEFKKQITLFDLGEIKYDLTELLNRQVDIVTERAINKRIKEYIYKDLKIIFE